ESALHNVGKKTGISVPAIDYLVSRARLDKATPEFRKLYFMVKKMYETEATYEWADYSKTFEEDEEELTGKLTDPEAFWISCGGDLHKSTEPCDNCRELLKDEPVVPIKVNQKKDDTLCSGPTCPKIAKIFLIF